MREVRRAEVIRDSTLPLDLLPLSRGFCDGLVRGHLLQVVPELASGFAQRVAWLLRLVSGVTQRDGRQPGL